MLYISNAVRVGRRQSKGQRVQARDQLRRGDELFLRDPRQVAFHDPDHSKDEERELLVGHSNKGRLLIVICTIRADTIRIISARRATRQEAKVYAQGI